MNDQTALWLLSALIQSMAVIWGLFMIVYIFFLRDLLLKAELNVDQGFTREESKTIYQWNLLILFFNVLIILAILNGIFGLLFFRNDFLIISTVLYSVISVLMVGAFSGIIIHGILQHYLYNSRKR